MDGRKALVTGGASGIGAATCRALHAAGAQVTIADIDQPGAEALSRELPGASVLILDITDEAAVASALARIAALDILVNNAGIGLVGGVVETALADFERLFRVNVQGMFLVTRAAMPLLLESRGSIVNIGSVAGLVGVKKRFAYCATKGAVIAITRQLAVDYPTELRANCICPGTVDTPFVEAYLEKYHWHEKEKVRAELNQRQPVGRLGRPEEIANMVLYLCSPEAEFVTGDAGVKEDCAHMVAETERLYDSAVRDGPGGINDDPEYNGALILRLASFLGVWGFGLENRDGGAHAAAHAVDAASHAATLAGAQAAAFAGTNPPA